MENAVLSRDAKGFFVLDKSNERINMTAAEAHRWVDILAREKKPHRVEIWLAFWGTKKDGPPAHIVEIEAVTEEDAVIAAMEEIDLHEAKLVEAGNATRITTFFDARLDKGRFSCSSRAESARYSDNPFVWHGKENCPKCGRRHAVGASAMCPGRENRGES